LAQGEDVQPKTDLSNMAVWYRHLVQDNPRENAALLESLRGALNEFSFLELEKAGETNRSLLAEFSRSGGTSIKFAFHELSDGQRCLICLYTILHFLVEKGSTVIVDEPENFIALREIQPWLMAVTDATEKGDGQILLISHHPEVFDQWAPNCGVQFVRDGLGPVRVEQFRADPESTLSPSELIARGWERG